MTGGAAATSTGKPAPAIDNSAATPANLQDRLASLARLSKQDVPPAAFFQTLLQHFAQDVPLRWAVVWSRSGPRWHRLAQLPAQPPSSEPGSSEPESPEAESAQQATVEQEIATHAAAAITAAVASEPPAVHTQNLQGGGALLTLAVSESRNVLLQVAPLAHNPAAPAPAAAPPAAAPSPEFAAQLLAAYGQLSDDFDRNRSLRFLQGQVLTLRRVVRLSDSAHASLDIDRTAFEIAAACSELPGCQRASVLVRDHRRYRVAAVSGLAILDHRSPLIRCLVDLATAVAASGQALIHGNEPHNLPPQLAQPLDAYLDRAHASGLLAVPLSRRAAEEDAPPSDTQRASDPLDGILGVLVLETGDLAALPALQQQTAAWSACCAAALGNALEHSTLPLRGLAAALRQANPLWRWRAGGRLAAVAIVLLAMIAALIWIPAPLRVAAVGELKPAQIDQVFAPRDGYVSEIFVEHNQAVQPGKPLLNLHSPDLELELRRTEGAIESTQQQLRAAEAARRRGAPESADLRDDAARFAAGESHLRAVLESYQQQLALLRAEQAHLKLHSALDGVVLTWQVQQTLQGRPVQRGQRLLQIAAANSPWILVLAVPDQDVGRVLKAQRDAAALPVEYILATHPQHRRSGTVIEVAQITTLSDTGEPVVEVTVQVDDADLLQPRAGAQVQAEILCGTASLGYVWFHRLWDALWARILF